MTPTDAPGQYQSGHTGTPGCPSPDHHPAAHGHGPCPAAVNPQSDFYEDDEPVDKILADRRDGRPGVTDPRQRTWNYRGEQS